MDAMESNNVLVKPEELTRACYTFTNIRKNADEVYQESGTFNF